MVFFSRTPLTASISRLPTSLLLNFHSNRPLTPRGPSFRRPSATLFPLYPVKMLLWVFTIAPLHTPASLHTRLSLIVLTGQDYRSG